MNRLSGKVALISGGARGMGASHAEVFVAEGAKVIIADIRIAEGESLAARLGSACLFQKLDVTAPRDWSDAVRAAEAAFGPISVLVNNAGIAEEAMIEDADDAHYHRVISINQTSVFMGTRAVIPSMRRANGGSIVNIASIASMTGHPKGAVYAASKGAVTAFSRAAALELAPYRIRVNSIHPGVIRTPMLGDVGVADIIAPLIPLRRIGEPLEISMLAVYLASDESSFSTGSQFVADGGYTAQ